MSIELFTGTVGSGKSYHALSQGLEQIKNRNSFVVANFPIKAKKDKEKDRWVYLETIEIEDLIKLSFERGIYGKEGKGLVIFDEAGVIFNSRDWQINPERRKEWIKFFSQSRKFGYDIIFVAQDERMIDRQIRKLAEYEVQHKKLRNYKLMKLLPFNVFAYVYHWSGGGFKGSVRFAILNPFKAKKYDSMKMFDMPDDVKELAMAHGYEVDSRPQEENAKQRKGGVRGSLFSRLRSLIGVTKTE